MAAIEVPYSLELTKLEDARDVTAGTTATVATGKLKIYLGATVDPTKMQSVVGTLQVVFREFMFREGRGTVSTNRYAYAPVGGTAMDVTIAGATTGIGVGDVALSVSSTFSATGETEYFSETFDQLINKLLENTVEN